MIAQDRRPPVGARLRVLTKEPGRPFNPGITAQWVSTEPVAAHLGQYVYVEDWGRFHVLDDQDGPGRWTVGDVTFEVEDSA